MPQLDGLRAFAVLGVLLTHFADAGVLGYFGVRLFFVLSGFLITGLLLESRKAIEAGISTPRRQLARFYTRRMLRLYPPLLVFIGLCLVFDLGGMRYDWPWHASYLSNLFLTTHPGYHPYPVFLLWTLSIEEQFYLLWPLFILFTPRRYLVRGCVAAVCAGVAWRALAWGLGFDGVGVVYSPVNGLNTLGMGALVAVLPNDAAERLRWYGRNVGPWLLLPVIALSVVRPGTGVDDIFMDVACALVFVWIVRDAAAGFKGATGRILSFPVVRYIGRISYGVYLYHLFAIPLLRPVNISAARGFWLRSAVAIALASLSWFVLEQPVKCFRESIERRRVITQGDMSTLVDNVAVTPAV